MLMVAGASDEKDEQKEEVPEPPQQQVQQRRKEALLPERASSWEQRRDVDRGEVAGVTQEERGEAERRSRYNSDERRQKKACGGAVGALTSWAFRSL